MYFKLQLEPKFQFLTAVIGTDGRPYFLSRDVRKFLLVRNSRALSSRELESRLPSQKVKDLLPGGCYNFKYQRFVAVSEDTLIRVIETLKELDPELHAWFQVVWIEGHVAVTQTKSFVDACETPYLAHNLAKMPTFVRNPDVNEDALRTRLLPLLVHSTLSYYHQLKDVSEGDGSTMPECFSSPPSNTLEIPQVIGGGRRMKSPPTKWCSGGPPPSQEVSQGPEEEKECMLGVVDADTIPEDWSEKIYSVDGYKGNKQTCLGCHEDIPDFIMVHQNGNNAIIFRPVNRQLPRRRDSATYFS